uniref:AlNc14C157G7669 protein n=1 Tax=Albugo laibachii Nc14 TaxID=890382 RepID=F0WMH9_9STRA|nr:AlNc14C157G7669 [Albugo laibachii Nc14]|eukprot:CCA22511.1 AlNc14C157G7669 [Albugo laibachii Nc14]
MNIQLLKAYILAIIGVFPVHHSAVDVGYIKLVRKPSANSAERVQRGVYATISKSEEKNKNYQITFSVYSVTEHYVTLPNCCDNEIQDPIPKDSPSYECAEGRVTLLSETSSASIEGLSNCEQSLNKFHILISTVFFNFDLARINLIG